MLANRLVALATCCLLVAFCGVSPRQEETVQAGAVRRASLGSVQREQEVIQLIQELQTTDELKQEEIIEALGKLGPTAADAVPAILAAVVRFNDLEDYVDDGDFYGIPETSIETLGKIGQAAVPHLIDALNSAPSGLVRFVAAASIGEIGPAAEDAIPSLVEAVKREDEGDDKFPEDVSGAALTALSKIGSRAIPALVDLFAEEDQRLKQMAAMGMARVRPEYQPGVALITKEIRRALRPPTKHRDSRENYYYVEALIRALGEFGKAAEEAVPLLTELQQDQDFRLPATRAIEKIRTK
jgi:HEAT repeat protein